MHLKTRKEVSPQKVGTASIIGTRTHKMSVRDSYVSKFLTSLVFLLFCHRRNSRRCDLSDGGERRPGYGSSTVGGEAVVIILATDGLWEFVSDQVPTIASVKRGHSRSDYCPFLF